MAASLPSLYLRAHDTPTVRQRPEYGSMYQKPYPGLREIGRSGLRLAERVELLLQLRDLGGLLGEHPLELDDLGQRGDVDRDVRRPVGGVGLGVGRVELGAVDDVVARGRHDAGLAALDDLVAAERGPPGA